MRLFLRKAWAPLPLSALALSSVRVAARKTAAEGTRTGRATPRMSAWISGGGVSAGGGDDGVLGRKQLGKEVPLVQAIYDELRTMQDPEAEAKRGQDSPVLSKVLRLMDHLEPSDLGVSESEFRGLDRSLCVPVVAGRSEGDFEMTMFVLPAGGAIPLHDHPNMAVLSRVLFGSLEVDSYDVAPCDDGDEDGTLSASASKEGEAVPTVSAGGGLRRGAASRQARAVDAATPSFLLTPSAGNVHAFRAPVACAVFDVLIPPYNNSRGRKCSYFRVETPSLTASATDTSSVVDRARNGSEGGGLNRLGEDVHVEGKGGRDPLCTRVVLEEIPEPKGLPRWSRYHGPEVLQR